VIVIDNAHELHEAWVIVMSKGSDGLTGTCCPSCALRARSCTRARARASRWRE
jgi:hypothetical protein